MRDQNPGRSTSHPIAQTAPAFRLKVLVTNREDFVQKVNLVMAGGGCREEQPCRHSGRIGQDWVIETVPELRELLDIGDHCGAVTRRKAMHVEEPVGIGAAGKLWVSDKPKLIKARESPVDRNRASVRRIDAADYAEKSGLSGPVASEHPDELSFRNIETNVSKRLECWESLAAAKCQPPGIALIDESEALRHALTSDGDSPGHSIHARAGFSRCSRVSPHTHARTGVQTLTMASHR